jgi:hypothetical protein
MQAKLKTVEHYEEMMDESLNCLELLLAIKGIAYNNNKIFTCYGLFLYYECPNHAYFPEGQQNLYSSPLKLRIPNSN